MRKRILESPSSFSDGFGRRTVVYRDAWQTRFLTVLIAISGSVAIAIASLNLSKWFFGLAFLLVPLCLKLYKRGVYFDLEYVSIQSFARKTDIAYPTISSFKVDNGLIHNSQIFILLKNGEVIFCPLFRSIFAYEFEFSSHRSESTVDRLNRELTLRGELSNGA